MKRVLSALPTLWIVAPALLGAAEPTAQAMPENAAALQAACEAKVMKACFDVAKKHWSGGVTGWIDWNPAWKAFKDGVAIDEAKAMALHQKDCDGGAAAACYDLGIMHGNGWGVPKDQAKAAQAYQKSCEGGDAAGCYGFGQALRLGSGVPKDEARAL